MDDRGTLESTPVFDLATRYEDLYAAGVGHPNVLAGPSVDDVIRIDPVTLVPLDSAITIDMPSDEAYQLGTVTFGETQE